MKNLNVNITQMKIKSILLIIIVSVFSTTAMMAQGDDASDKKDAADKRLA